MGNHSQAAQSYEWDNEKAKKNIHASAVEKALDRERHFTSLMGVDDEAG
jgi:hypothetical protein